MLRDDAGAEESRVEPCGVPGASFSVRHEHAFDPTGCRCIMGADGVTSRPVAFNKTAVAVWPSAR